jgi:pimeloyl-ACP methyl ester carboxylesterase
VREDFVPASGGVRLHVRIEDGPEPPFLLVHGLASNARTWDGVAERLAAAGHRVVAVDLRSHGESEAPEAGYDTLTAAADLAAVCSALGLQRPFVAGQSWGGNVVLQLAADDPELPRAVAAVDGGWIQLADTFPSWEECAARLAPPDFIGARASDIETRIRAAHRSWPESGIAGTLANFRFDADGGAQPRLSRPHHMAILRSLWEHSPRALYPRITAPVLLMPAGGNARANTVAEAAAALKEAAVRPYPEADHDVHAQHPAEVAADLLRFDSASVDRTGSADGAGEQGRAS